MKISGSMIQAYMICPRQAWLMSRQICGDQYNEFLAIGRLYAEETYKKEKKEVIFENNKIDVVKREKNFLTIIETKKSSKMLQASKMQLLNYLYVFSKKGYKVKGEIRIPKEKKIISIELGEKEKIMVEKIHQEIKELIDKEKIPKVARIRACRNCSHNEFCWS